MRVSYDKDQRRTARNTGQRLYTFQITGLGGRGSITTQGIFTAKTLTEIKRYVDTVFKVLK